jgi:signal transduction histidine kinase
VQVLLAIGTDVVLRVIDDGVGLPPEPAAGDGLRNLRERAEMLGGSCEVGPATKGGTVVEWRVPLHPRAV